MLRATAGLGNERHDIRERLPRLCDKISALETLLGIPADLAGEKNHATLGDGAIAKAFGRFPSTRMKKCVRSGHLLSPHENLRLKNASHAYFIDIYCKRCYP